MEMQGEEYMIGSKRGHETDGYAEARPAFFRHVEDGSDVDGALRDDYETCKASILIY